MQKTNIVFKGPIDCAASIIRQNGIKGLFQGGFATIWAEFPAFMSQFVIYETCKRKIFAPGCFFGIEPTTDSDNFKEFTGSLSGWRALAAGGISGFFCWLTCFPADIIKTRIQF